MRLCLLSGSVHSFVILRFREISRDNRRLHEEDIIALESALSDVQYQIEGLSGTLRNYDRLITFSTIDVYLSEVRDLTIVQEEDTFLSDLKTAAVTGTHGLIHVVQSLILTVVSGWWIFLGIATLIMISYY